MYLLLVGQQGDAECKGESGLKHLDSTEDGDSREVSCIHTALHCKAGFTGFVCRAGLMGLLYRLLGA